MSFRGVVGVVLVAATVCVSCKKTDAPAAVIVWPEAPRRSLKEGLPSFSVGAQVNPAISIVVDKATPRDGLRALVEAFRTAREQRRLGELIPPTTPKGDAGPYAIVNVYVMDDPLWADAKHLSMAVSADVTRKFSAAFDAHTLATYVLNQAGTVSELGGLGANGAKTWERLFPFSTLPD